MEKVHQMELGQSVIKGTADSSVKYGQDVSSFDRLVEVMQTQVENVIVLTVTKQDVLDKENKIPKNLNLNLNACNVTKNILEFLRMISHDRL